MLFLVMSMALLLVMSVWEGGKTAPDLNSMGICDAIQSLILGSPPVYCYWYINDPVACVSLENRSGRGSLEKLAPHLT